MIRSSALPLLAAVAFSIWGLFIVGVQNLFFRVGKEYRKMILTGLYLLFLVVSFGVLIIFYHYNHVLSYNQYYRVTTVILLVTVGAIFILNSLSMIRRKRYFFLRGIIYTSALVLVLAASAAVPAFIMMSPLSLFFSFFLLLETLFLVFLHDRNPSLRHENRFLIVLHAVMFPINIIDWYLKYTGSSSDLIYGIGILGLFLPLYFIIKYIEIKDDIRDNLILINAILDKERKSYSSSIYLIVNMLESKNQFIRGHSERVSFFSSVIGNQIGLSATELEELQNACLLHDIGYIGVSFENIVNSGVYSSQEFSQIKQHPVIGSEILSRSSVFSRYAETILYHHENWNGSGYPAGISGNKIPLFSRIIQIADSFDIMTTDKFYRSALSRDDALLILKSGKGEEFDPYLVDIFIKSVRIDI